MNHECRQGKTELVESPHKEYIGRRKSESSSDNVREPCIMNIEAVSDASDMEPTAAIAVVDKGKRPLRKRRRESATADASSQSDAGSGKNIPWCMGFIRPGTESSDTESSETFVCYYKGYNSADTAVVEDSEDDLFFLEEETEDGRFPVEYEPPDSESEEDDDDDDEQQQEQHDAVPGRALYEEDPGAEAGDEYDDNGDTDSEIDEEDIWTCNACFTQNYPITQRCAKCWIQRGDNTQHPCRTSLLPTPHLRPVVPAKFPVHRSISDAGTASCSTSVASQSISTHQERPSSSLDTPQDFPSLPSCSSSDSGFSSHPSSDILPHRSHGNVETPSITVDSSDTSKADKGDEGSGKPVELYGEMCVVCLTQPRNASFVHGDTGHQVCCFACADKLKAGKKKCPVCREKIQMVIKNFF